MAENNLEKKLKYFYCSKEVSPSRKLITIPGKELPQIKMDVYFLKKDYQKSIDDTRHIFNSIPYFQETINEVPEESLEDYATSVVDSYFDVVMAKHDKANQEELIKLVLLPLTYKSCLLQGHGTYDKKGRWAVSIGETCESTPIQELTKELFDEGYKAIYLKICNPQDHELPSSGRNKFVIYPIGDFGLLSNFGLDAK